MSYERLAAQTRSVKKSPIILAHQLHLFSNISFLPKNYFYINSLLSVKKKVLDNQRRSALQTTERRYANETRGGIMKTPWSRFLVAFFAPHARRNAWMGQHNGIDFGNRERSQRRCGPKCRG